MFKYLTSFACAASILLLASSGSAEEKKPLLGDFNAGATLGLGLPSPFSGQLLVKYKKVIGLNAEYGFLPELSLPVGDGVNISQHMADFSLHVYPFKGAFFLGCGLGWQNLSASSSVTQKGVTGTTTAEVDTLFVSPRLGFLHRFDFGLAIGMDVGVQLPVSGTTSLSGSVGGVSVPVNLLPTKDVSDVADKVETTPIPIVHLLQLGYVL